MIQIPEAQAVEDFSKLLYEAMKGQEVVIIGRDGNAFKLVALTRLPAPLFGSAEGQVSISPDFDEPIEGLEDYMP